MFKRLFSSGLVCICFAILFSSCSLFSQGTSSGNTVNISTNQATYHAGDAIQVGITNNFQTPIYAYDGRAGCSILILSAQIGNLWTQSNAAPCTQKHKTNVVKIDSGQTYNATVTGTFAPGNYRFSLTYSSNSNMVLSDANRVQNTTQSATFSFAK